MHDIIYRIIYNTAKFFYPKTTLEGLDNIPKVPCILVGNHAQVHGPVIAELYIPEKRLIWCNGEMKSMQEVPDYAYQDFWSDKPGWQKPFWRVLSYVIAPLCQMVFTRADIIPVYRDARIVETFKETVQMLQDGYNIVIFPEHAVDYNGILCEFEEHFVDVAKLYYRKAGVDVAFVPMYLAPQLHKVCFGKPVYFNHEAKIKNERGRICSALMTEITDMAVALPEHRVVPYKNIRKRDYPSNESAHVKI